MPELRRAQLVDGAAKVRVVQDVVEIASELRQNPLCEMEPVAQRDVPLHGAECAQGFLGHWLCRGQLRRGDRCVRSWLTD
jgi:hypothetical protein